MTAGQRARAALPLHDPTDHMEELGIAADLRGAWLAGVEDALEERGFDACGDQGDGHDRERRALAGTVR